MSGQHQFYSATGCTVSKCKVDLKFGFHYAARKQHSVDNQIVDSGCEQVPCTNKDPSKGEIYIPGAVADKCNIKVCDEYSYIKSIKANKCEPCPDGFDCDGTTKPPKKACTFSVNQPRGFDIAKYDLYPCVSYNNILSCTQPSLSGSSRSVHSLGITIVSQWHGKVVRGLHG